MLGSYVQFALHLRIEAQRVKHKMGSAQYLCDRLVNNYETGVGADVRALKKKWSTLQSMASTIIVPYGLFVSNCSWTLGVGFMFVNILLNAKTMASLVDTEIPQDGYRVYRKLVACHRGEAIRQACRLAEVLWLSLTSAGVLACICSSFQDQRLLMLMNVGAYILCASAVVAFPLLCKFEWVKSLNPFPDLTMFLADKFERDRSWHVKRSDATPTQHCMTLLGQIVLSTGNFAMICFVTPNLHSCSTELLRIDGFKTPPRTALAIMILAAGISYFILASLALLLAQCTHMFPGLSFAAKVQVPLFPPKVRPLEQGLLGSIDDGIFVAGA